MKRLVALAAGFTFALLCGASALAQSTPPPLPQLTPEESQTVEQRLDPYRRETEGRVSRGEITAAEADRLLAWREWQLARQVAGIGNEPAPSDVPPGYDAAQAPRDHVVVQPPPVYYAPPVYGYPAPYYYAAPRPYYYAPRPYYWGPAVCAGGFGRNFAGRVCF